MNLAVRGTETRNRILEFIRYRSKTNQPNPSYREIGEAINIRSTSTIYSHIHTLAGEKKIKIHKWGSARSVELIKSQDEICKCCGGSGWRDLNEVTVGNP